TSRVFIALAVGAVLGLGVQTAFGNSDIFRTDIVLDSSVDGNNFFYGVYQSPDTTFAKNFGTFYAASTGTNYITLNNAHVFTFEDSGDHATAAFLNYRVYLQNTTAPSYTFVQLDSNSQSGNNKDWFRSSAINTAIVHAGMDAGTYNFE